MSLEQDLRDRSGNVCELSGSTEDLDIYAVPNSPDLPEAETHIFISETCRKQLEDKATADIVCCITSKQKAGRKIC